MSEDDMSEQASKPLSTVPRYSYGSCQIVLLDDFVQDFVSRTKEMSSIPGWHLLSRFEVKNQVVDGVGLPMISEEQAAKLVDLAQEDCHAYDLAKFIAGQHIAEVCYAEQNRMPPILYSFSAKVLKGETKRPKAFRSYSEDSVLRAFAYALCKTVAETTTLKLSRNREQKNESYSACDAVAEAFCKAGHNLTWEQVHSICNDKSNEKIRQLAKYLGLLTDNSLKC